MEPLIALGITVIGCGGFLCIVYYWENPKQFRIIQTTYSRIYDEEANSYYIIEKKRFGMWFYCKELPYRTKRGHLEKKWISSYDSLEDARKDLEAAMDAIHGEKPRVDIVW